MSSLVDVSTIIQPVIPQSEIDRLNALRQLLQVVGDAHHLLSPERLMMRLNVLDKLDALIGDLDSRSLHSLPGSELIRSAGSIRFQFEAANETLYETAHAEIALQGSSPTLDGWLSELVKDRELERSHP